MAARNWLFVRFEHESEVAALKPDMAALAKLSPTVTGFAAFAFVAILLFVTPRARHQPVVLVASAAWLVSTVLVLVGNVRVIDAQGLLHGVFPALDRRRVDGEPAHGNRRGHHASGIGASREVQPTPGISRILLVVLQAEQ